MVRHWHLQMLEYEHRSREALNAAERNREASNYRLKRGRTKWARQAALVLAGLFGLAHLLN